MQTKKLKLFMLTCIAILALTGCKEKEEPTFTLAGSVTDIDTGNAIEGVTVELISSGSGITYKKETNSEGKYQFQNLPGGDYNVSFTKTDYSDGGSANLKLGANIPTYDKKLSYTKSLDLRGKVTDAETGAAINGVTVKISAGSETATNTNGEYSFSDLKRGSYTLVFDKAVYVLTEKTVSIAAGAEANRLDVALTPAVTQLTGRVTNAGTGAAISGATVRLNPAATPATATTNSNGEYTFTGLKQSAYAITCTATNFYDKTANVTVVNRNESNTHNIELSPSSSTAKVNINYALTIENGASFYLSFTKEAVKYYVTAYLKSALPSDDKIKSDLLADQEFEPDAADIIYLPSLPANTNYVFCAIALDGANTPGQLTKYEFSTKSATGAFPLAKLSVDQITSGRAYFSTVMNTYCKGYFMAQMKRASNGDISDIELAMEAYGSRTESDYWQTVGLASNNYYYSNQSNSIYVIFTLGFSSASTGGGTTGLLSRAWYSTSTNSVLRSAPLLDSTNENIGLKASAKSSGSMFDAPRMLQAIDKR